MTPPKWLWKNEHVAQPHLSTLLLIFFPPLEIPHLWYKNYPDKRSFPVFQINLSIYFATIAINSFAIFHEGKQCKNWSSI